ncbi:stage III sporulation protein AE [Thermoanaerobacter mathranii subsp. mathranii str. A3]|uniref:Stage III sporulation protein AE n=1 Tax=Thermoanaerobacter mathranii subsp. mathranii (strain DSM 11426 / CCUG 53645 / CIP 108742 / A3) TaxID=583358 RepID=A0ABM5LQ53_THEM3|nr:stage III sporulation protein AE [Thermoanaerobacter mathranii]ADH60854.1 stage III sporulation protein AE [Thermoanaerobacter mathranii subsp. mathranii str. A3]
MKKLVFVILMIMSLLTTAKADTGQQDIERQLRGIDTYQIDRFVKETNQKNGNIFPYVDIKTYIGDVISGKQSFDINKIFKNLLKLFFKELYSSVKLLTQLLILAVIGGILMNLHGSFENENISEIAFLAVYGIFIVIAVKSFIEALGIGKEAIDSMVDFMQSMLPVLITLLVSVGAFTSAAFFHPVVIVTVQFIAHLMRDFILPIILLMTAVKIVGNISEKFSLNKMGDFLKTLSTASISILLSIFLGVITIQGLSSSMADGVISRTAKYTVGAFLPVVGGLLSDSVDAVIGASLLIKGAVGIYGLIAIVIISAMPLIKLFSLIIIYRFTAAVIEPISDKRIVNCLSEVATSLTYVFGVLASVTVMMFFTITAIIGTASITTMLR